MDGKEATFLMYRVADEDVSVNALIKDESIWLSQKGISKLSNGTCRNSVDFIQNCFTSIVPVDKCGFFE